MSDQVYGFRSAASTGTSCDSCNAHWEREKGTSSLDQGLYTRDLFVDVVAPLYVEGNMKEWQVFKRCYCWTVAAATNTNNVNSYVTFTSGPTTVFLPAPDVSSIATRLASLISEVHSKTSAYVLGEILWSFGE